jgi:Family of unknown function (DUF6573)
MTDHLTQKPLSHDEKKAAEAAFSGRPFNPAWSAGARFVYDGILKALPAPPNDSTTVGTTASTPINSLSTGQHPAEGAAIRDEGRDSGQADLPATITDIEQAIEAGVLIDVTPTAQQLGMSFPITITKPLWEADITVHQTLTEEDTARRLRDVLMAFRLRLSSLVTVSPLIDFPALLAIPPGTIPQPIPLFALIQPNKEHQATVTLLLPNEVATTIIPMN